MHTHRPTLAKAEQWFGGDEEDHPAQNSTFVKCAKTALPNTPAPEGNLSSGYQHRKTVRVRAELSTLTPNCSSGKKTKLLPLFASLGYLGVYS